jgi:hypothetical protein
VAIDQIPHNTDAERAPARCAFTTFRLEFDLEESSFFVRCVMGEMLAEEDRGFSWIERGRARDLNRDVIDIAACPLPNCPILVGN